MHVEGVDTAARLRTALHQLGDTLSGAVDLLASARDHRTSAKVNTYINQ